MWMYLPWGGEEGREEKGRVYSAFIIGKEESIEEKQPITHISTWNTSYYMSFQRYK